MPELTVAIDARLPSGLAGGVESIILGLAAGLARLGDGNEKYLFLAHDDSRDWLAPSISGPCAFLSAGPSPAWGEASRLRLFATTTAPRLSGALKSSSLLARLRLPPLARSDGRIERAGAEVMHFTTQRAFVTDVPSIYHPHDLQHVHLPRFFSPRQHAIRERSYGFFCHQATTVAVTSSWTRSDLIEHFGLAPEKVKVLPWAPVNTEYPVPTKSQLREAQERFALPERFILYPAQTWPHKNHLGLLEAVAVLRSQHGLNVPLVSSGFQTEFFTTLIEREHRLGLTDLVHWVGFVTPLQMQCLYHLATAVVVPTRFEAASGPVWEAFVAGIPVACSNVTSLPEQAGDAALLFDPDDVAAMADAIARLWTDADLRRVLIARGRDKVRPFSWDHTARLFRAEYRRIARRSPTEEDTALLVMRPPI